MHKQTRKTILVPAVRALRLVKIIEGGLKWDVVDFGGGGGGGKAHLMLGGSEGMLPHENLDPLRQLLVHFQVTLHYLLCCVIWVTPLT